MKESSYNLGAVQLLIMTGAAILYNVSECVCERESLWICAIKATSRQYQTALTVLLQYI